MNQQVSLEHEFVDFTGLAHHLFAIWGKQQSPSVKTAVSSLDYMHRIFFGCDFGGCGYGGRGALYGANEIRKGRKGNVIWAEFAAIEFL